MNISNKVELNDFIFHCLLSEFELQNIIDELQISCGVSIHIFDVNSNVIIESKIQDLLVRKIIAEKIFSAKSFNDMLGTDIVNSFEIEDRIYILYPIIKNATTFGLVIINQLASELKNSELLKEIAVVISRLYIYFHYLAEPESNASDYFETGFARELLLHNGSLSNSLFREMYTPKPHMGTLIFSPSFVILDFSCENSFKLSQLDNSISRFIPNSFRLIHKENLLVFVYAVGANSALTYSELILKLEQITNMHLSFCGVSPIFTNLLERQNFKRLAKYSLLLGKTFHQGRVFQTNLLYCDVLLYSAIDKMRAEGLELSDISKLANYDKNHGTAYLDTLDKYLACGNRLTLASTKLFIDRSTLKYRLLKIEDMLSLSLDDYITARKLSIAINIHKLIAIYPKSDLLN